MTTTAKTIIELAKVLRAVVDGFQPDPGTSDLGDEQPIHICIPLGIYRKAQWLITNEVSQ